MELSLKEINLNEYNLHSNPFPNVGIPDDPVVVYTNRKKELQIIADAITGTLRGSSSHVAMVGSYGNGKTTTLKFVKNQIEKQLSNTLPIYLSYCGDTFIEFYRNFMYELGLDRLEHFVWEYLEYATDTDQLKEKIQNGDILLPNILEKGRRILFKEIKYTDFSTGFLELILEETKLTSWKYLCGEPIIHEQRKAIDVVTLIDTDEKALRAFMSLKIILNKIGYEIICILIDELESIEVLHPFKKQKILNSIRRLIDLNPSGLCLILACAPEAWSSIIRDYHAFSERIFREVILRPLNYDFIKQFVEDYLNLSRIKKGEENGIFPFTDSALEETLIAAQGNMRQVLAICNLSINRGADRNFPLLTSEILHEILPHIFRQGEDYEP